jgi:hypothetical protein
VNAVALGIGDQRIAAPAHVGLIHDGEAERRRFQLGFLGPAVEDPHQGIVLLGLPELAAAMLRHFEADLGRSLDGAARSGRILVAHYDRDPDQLLEIIGGAIATLTASGQTLIRFFAQVTWGAAGFPLPEDELWVESRLNDLLENTAVVLVCAYDASQVPAWALVRGGLDTHPLVVIGDRLAENPNYLAPSKYLRERLLRCGPPGG